jgi:hypothetical protein
MELENYIYGLLAAILILVIIKTIHFLKHKNRNWKFRHWFYFSRKALNLSTSDERAILKRKQNVYSIFIYILLIITVVYSFITFLSQS